MPLYLYLYGFEIFLNKPHVKMLMNGLRDIYGSIKLRKILKVWDVCVEHF
jgi:hypothetical protein